MTTLAPVMQSASICAYILKMTLLAGAKVWFDLLSLSILDASVPPQWLSHWPLYADGDHHGAKTDLEQLYGAWLPVSAKIFSFNSQMSDILWCLLFVSD